MLDALFAKARTQPQAPPIHEMIALVADNSSKGFVFTRWLKWGSLAGAAVLLLWILLFAWQQFQPTHGSSATSALPQAQTASPSAHPDEKSSLTITPSDSHAEGSVSSQISPAQHEGSLVPLPAQAPSVSGTASTIQQEGTDSQDYSLLFDGIDDFIQVPSSEGFEPESTLTVEAWVKAEGTPTSVQPVLGKQFSNYQTADEKPPLYSYTLSLGKPDGSMTKHWVFSLSGGTPGSEVIAVSPKEYTRDVWTHIAATYNSKRVTLYINGDSVVSVPRTGAIGYDTLPLFFGTFPTKPGRKAMFFQGQLDEVRIWNIARSTNDIKATMNKRLVSPHNGLVVYWNCNEGKGNSINDIFSHLIGHFRYNHTNTQKGPQWVTSTVPFKDRIQ